MRALTQLRSPRGTSRVVTAAPAGVLVVLLGWLILNGAMGGQVTLSKLGAISSLLVVILVTAAVGITVAAHQPRNLIGWLLDRWLHTKPVFLALFVVLGSAAGVRNVWRQFAPRD